MKFYIASGYGNQVQVTEFARRLISAGLELVFDWPKLGTITALDASERLQQIKRLADIELQSVKDADIFITVLPGGIGTHTELGMAIASGCKKIFICAPNAKDYLDIFGHTNVHYFRKGVMQSIGGMDDWVSAVINNV